MPEEPGTFSSLDIMIEEVEVEAPGTANLDRIGQLDFNQISFINFSNILNLYKEDKVCICYFWLLSMFINLSNWTCERVPFNLSKIC